MRNSRGIERSIEQWDDLAEQWEDQAQDHGNKYTKRSHWVCELIERNRIGPCKTLDVGCANGLLSSLLADRGFDTYGVDISDHLIHLAVRRMEKYFEDADRRFRASPDGILSFSGESFKLVTMIGVFSYIENHEKYVTDLKRILDQEEAYLVATGTNRFSIYVMGHICKMILGFRPTREWAGTLANWAQTGVESGGNVDRRRAVQVHGSKGFDRLFRQAGFEKRDEMDLFHISFLDRNPLNRTGLGKLLANLLGWAHVGVYRKLNG